MGESFILSQTSVVLATLTGIYFLNQRKTSKEMFITIIGLILILAAATVTVFIK
ncbi:GRP family sugar transporter [Staphylococcus pseudintermedius]|nr:GRP family sugar transporter [Staphylococcus pseudintermedius]